MLNELRDTLCKAASLIEDYSTWEGPLRQAELYRAVRRAVKMREAGLKRQRLAGFVPIPIPIVGGLPVTLSIVALNNVELNKKINKMFDNPEDRKAIKQLSQEIYSKIYKTPRTAKWFGLPGLITSMLSGPSTQDKRDILYKVMKDFKKDVEEMYALEGQDEQDIVSD